MEADLADVLGDLVVRVAARTDGAHEQLLRDAHGQDTFDVRHEPLDRAIHLVLRAGALAIYRNELDVHVRVQLEIHARLEADLERVLLAPKALLGVLARPTEHVDPPELGRDHFEGQAAGLARGEYVFSRPRVLAELVPNEETSGARLAIIVQRDDVVRLQPQGCAHVATHNADGGRNCVFGRSFWHFDDDRARLRRLAIADSI